MSRKYLLPCSCGRKIAIEAVQSGQTVVCECGRRLDVPTMLQIRSLEPAEEEAPPAQPQRRWGARQALVLLGGLVVVVAGFWALQLFLNRPRPPVPPALDQVRRDYDGLSLTQTFLEWKHLSAGLDRHRAKLFSEGYGRARGRYRDWMGVAVVVGLLGAACAASGLLIPQARPEQGPDNSDQQE